MKTWMKIMGTKISTYMKFKIMRELRMIFQNPKNLSFQRIYRRRKNNIQRFEIIDQVIEGWNAIIDTGTTHRFRELYPVQLVEYYKLFKINE